MREHPITGMALEDGSGHMPDDWQARHMHIPYIRATQGDKVAERMLLELDHAVASTADAWNEWRKAEQAKIVAKVSTDEMVRVIARPVRKKA